MRLPSCSPTEVNSSKNIKGCNHPYRQPQPSLSEIEILYLESVRNTHAHNFFELDFRAVVDLHIIIVDKIGGYRSREELVDLHDQHSLPIDVDVAKVVRIAEKNEALVIKLTFSIRFILAEPITKAPSSNIVFSPTFTPKAPKLER